MRSLCHAVFAVVLMCLAFACGNKTVDPVKPEFVSVRDGKFYIGDSTYRFVGTNFWYGAILGSIGRGGDRARLIRELDELDSLGIDNLRILVGGDGLENIPSHIMPVLQSAPGVYNDTILDGLDFLLSEMEKRGMKAVLYLNNSWEWSGGYGTYLEWVGEGMTPNPNIDGYKAYTDHVSKFVHNDSAKSLAADHVRCIVSRTNRYTGLPYAESPAIMSWQISNEPRAFASDSLSKALFADWLISQAALIKSLDPNHLVSTGSEGLYGCEVDIDLWTQIHSDSNIDYATIHIWPYNWNWAFPESLISDVDSSCIHTDEYIAHHTNAISAIGKPIVLEEFGYPRDNMSYLPGSPTIGRDGFYAHILSLIGKDGALQGCNFWGWGGEAVSPHDIWEPWDPYTGDPAQEPQGLNSVFSSDSSTIYIIRSAIERLGKN